MTAALFVLAVLIYTVGAMGYLYWSSRRGLMADRCRRRVIVTTKTDAVFAGVLYETDRDVCVLREAQVIGDGGARVGADGELCIFRADIAYIQLP